MAARKKIEDMTHDEYRAARLRAKWQLRPEYAADLIERLRDTAEAFRVAMVTSGATTKVPQDQYFDQLRALESAIAEAR